MAVWRRQKKAWRVVVVWMVVNRFLKRLVEQYASIFIRLLGASPVQLGATQSVLGFAGMLIALPLGLAHDRYSLRKLYLAGITLMAIVPLATAVAPDWKWLVPAILLMGLGQRIGACGVICDVSLPNHDRATAKALCEGVGALPTVIAPTIAAAIVMWMGGVAVPSIRVLYLVYFAVGLVPTIYAFRALPEIHRERAPSPRKNVLAEFKEVFEKGRGLKQYVALVAASEFTSLMLLTFVFPYAYEVGKATPAVLGIMGSAVTLAEVAFSVVFGRIADRLGRKRAYLFLVPIFALSNVLLVLSPTPFFLIVAGFMYGFRMIAAVIYSAIGPELVPTHCIGRWRGVLGLVTGIAHMVAPVIGGYLWQEISPQALFIAVALVDIGVAVPLMLALPETLKRTTPDTKDNDGEQGDCSGRGKNGG